MHTRTLNAALALALFAAVPVHAATMTAVQATQAQTAQQAADAKVLAGKLDTLHSDLQALIAALKAGSPVTAGTGAAAGPVAVAPAADLYFPADPGSALFPSPENSSVLRLGSIISGKPYLRDTNGSVHQLVAPSADNPNGYLVNGRPIKGDPCCTFNQMLERQGQVYIQLAAGQWQQFNSGMGSIYNATLPDALTAASAAGGTTASASTVPTLPAPYTIAPGSSGRVLKAAPGQVASVLATAKDGDTLDLDGSYAEKVPSINVALLVRLAPGTDVDFTDQELAQGKGGFVPSRDFILEGPAMDKPAAIVRGAGIKEVSAGGTACVRPSGTSYITLRGNLLLTRCQNGVAGGGFPWVLDMTDTVLDGNGLGDGYTHNMYASEGAMRVTLTRVTSRNPRGGHAIKVRAPMFSCNACTLSADETLVDLPNGTATVATVVNSTLTKNPGAANHRLIGYGEEGAKNGTAGLTVTGGTITGGDSPFVQGAGTVTFDQVTIVGTKPTGQGVTLKGL